MQINIFTIYVLKRGNKVYVGKTKGKRMSAVVSRHFCGKYMSTQRYFAKPSPAPDLHVLHRSEMPPFVAYKYVLAYIRYFIDTGYEILNAPRSIQRAQDLKEDTQEIFDRISRTDITEILEDTYIEKVTSADIRSEKISDDTKKMAYTQLTIRLTTEEKKRFQELSANLNLNQRETLLYLFDKCNQTDPMFLDLEGDSYLRVLLDAYRAEIEKYKNINVSLLGQLKNYREDKNKKLLALRETIARINTIVTAYCGLMEKASPIPLKIEHGLYRGTEGIDRHKYPDTAGVYLIRPQMVLRGKGRYSAMFIICYGENGEHFKFRYYPKKNYVGVPIPDSPFSVRGSNWLVGCREANDGAMDLYSSFPLNVCFPDKNF